MAKGCGLKMGCTIKRVGWLSTGYLYRNLNSVRASTRPTTLFLIRRPTLPAFIDDKARTSAEYRAALNNFEVIDIGPHNF